LNSPNPFDREMQAHTFLKRELTGFAKHTLPSVQVRHELMRTVRQEALSPGNKVTRLPSDGFIETVYLGPVITFNHCFSLFYSLHSRVRL
jgi:hypothetical protein